MRLTLALPLTLAAGLAPLAAPAEIGNTDECRAAVAADPVKAREDASLWQRLGGGVPARLCEAAALAASGAHATAAQLLTAVAQNPNRAMSTGLRATVLGDAAEQWLAAGKPGLAREVLAQADKVTPPDADRQILLARAAAAEGDWPAAQVALEAAVAARPDDALAHALLAATLRNQGSDAPALAEAERAAGLAPQLPEALFELGAARAVAGDRNGASSAWLALIEAQPDSDLAALARANLQRLN